MTIEFLYDDTEHSQTRFISFFTDHSRYDLALINSDRFYGKTVVLDLQSQHFALFGSDNLNLDYIQQYFKGDDDYAQDLLEFLLQVIDN